MICFDAHVHIHTLFSIDGMLAEARHNFTRQLPKDAGDRPAAFVLFLAEADGCDFFTGLKETADRDRYTTPGGWRITPTEEAESLLLTRNDWPGGRLFILAGRQLVTAEKIEVLALATPAKFADGLTLDATVEAVRSHDALAVLPWGVGKWLGERGEILDDFLKRAAPEGLFVGDNGGRPIFWPAPRLFRTAAVRGIGLLPGSDPLPLPAEESRVGSYGGWLQGEITNDHPATDLRRRLTDRSHPVVPFGGRMGARRFLQAQVALRRLTPHKGV